MADTIDVAQQDEQVTYWLEQIEGAQRWSQNWYERGKDVLERYLDKKDAVSSSSHKMNVLWSNTETIHPALFAKDPNPSVSRRFRDKDPLGRWGAIIIERALSYDQDAYDVGYHTRAAIKDYLLPGRGQIWFGYKPQIVEGPPGPDGKPTEKLAWECCVTRHLNWKDFLTNQARTWDEVWWGAKRDYLSKEEVAEQIGKEAAGKLVFTEQEEGETKGDPGKRIKKAAVWEIWSKRDGKVFFVSKSCPEMLKPPAPPYLNFDGFFPFPRPITATTTSDSILPTPLFCQYQNQADEIDRLSQKINLLTKALRVAGIYSASAPELDGLLTDADSNVMIPVENWYALSVQGGLDSVIDFLPLTEIITALKQCYESREQAKAAMYEITGISDIVRGASDPNETATAQQIKSQWGGLRIRDMQKEVQRFVRDGMRLKSEIICENFQLETLKAMSNAPLLMEAEKQKLLQRQQLAQVAQQMAQQNPEQAQAIAQANPELAQMVAPLTPEEMQKLREPTWEEVYKFLKDEKLRGYRIDIETDSTIQADEQEEKQSRTEYLTAMNTLIATMGPMVMQAPKFAPLLGEMLLFGSRAFKAGDTLESAIEEAVDSLSQQAMLPPQQQQVAPDPAHQLAVRKQDHDEQKFQAEREDKKLDRETQQQQFQTQLSAKQESEKAKAEAMGKPAANISIGGDDIGKMLQQMLQAIADANAQGQQAILAAVQALQQAATAPKQIAVQRDAQGRIVGGTAQPVTMN